MVSVYTRKFKVTNISGNIGCIYFRGETFAPSASNIFVAIATGTKRPLSSVILFANSSEMGLLQQQQK